MAVYRNSPRAGARAEADRRWLLQPLLTALHELRHPVGLHYPQLDLLLLPSTWQMTMI